MTRLDTPRLILRDIIIDDLDDYLRYSFDPRFYAYISYVPTVENVRERVEKWISENAQTPRQRYIWSVLKKDSRKIIGNIRLWPSTFRGVLVVGYALDPDYWGKGLTTEALKAVTQFGHDVLKVHRIEAEASAENPGSYRVMEKAGYAKDGEKHYRYFLQGKVWPLVYEYASVRPELIEKP